MQTIREYRWPLHYEVTTVEIPDGWRPLAVWADGGELVLAASVNTESEPETEEFRILSPLTDLGALEEWGSFELAYLGNVGPRYVFLVLYPEPEPEDLPPPRPARRIGRLDLEKSQDQE